MKEEMKVSRDSLIEIEQNLDDALQRLTIGGTICFVQLYKLMRAKFQLCEILYKGEKK